MKLWFKFQLCPRWLGRTFNPPGPYFHGVSPWVAGAWPSVHKSLLSGYYMKLELMPLEEAKWNCLEQQQICSVFGGTVLGTPCEGPPQSHRFPPQPLQPISIFFSLPFQPALEETFNSRKVNVLFVKWDEVDRPLCSPAWPTWPSGLVTSGSWCLNFLEQHSKYHVSSCQESGAQAPHMVYIYNFLCLDYRPNVTFTANFLLIRWCSSLANWVMSQTGALKFKNAMDCGANRSWVEGEGGREPGEEMGKRKRIYWSGTASVIIKWSLVDLIKPFVDNVAEHVSNTSLSG